MSGSMIAPALSAIGEDLSIGDSETQLTPFNLVLAFAADSIAGGAEGFVRNVALPITAGLPDPAPCEVQFGQDAQ